MRKRPEVVILIVTMLILGYLLAPDYGVSWDEPDNIIYGQQALNAYLTLTPPEEWQSNLESKGPFFMATAEVFSRLLSRLVASWSQIEARHFTYFLSFTFAAAALYCIASLSLTRFGAFAATLLFVTQPLFFGHAFINPKDIPFMAFFLLTIMLGMLATRSFQAHNLSSWRTILWLAIVGIVLGLTVSIRVFGVFAGLLITISGWMRLKWRYTSAAIGTWILAGFSMYVSWPYLWGEPINRLLESMQVMLDFPWNNIVLYRGLLYPVDKLPWHYLPFITVVQLTEPLLLFSLVGGLMCFIAFIQKPRSEESSIFIILALWGALPYGYAIISGATVYDNSRQFLFALPPLALISAVVFDRIHTSFKRKWVSLLLLVLTLLPGIVNLARLHPYQYIYYNNLVGGVRGAFRSYELDYWATSYKEAMEKVNKIAPAEAAVAVRGPWQSAAPFARSDLKVYKLGGSESDNPPPIYIIISSRGNGDLFDLPEADTVTKVEVSDAILSVVKANPD